MNRLLILILMLFISDYTFAQISTDRPDQTESSLVLPKGTIQIESGFVSRKNELIFPNTLFRIGISKKFELRVNTNYIFKTNENENKISNFSDLEIGTKIQIYSSETSKTS
ncbi:MAG: transporter, partial [SAR202 cluster bacterium]|nr:transporter [SAR202 cluster bacterium]